jgi:tetratricopeptide (TPR) repeat protein
MAQVDEHSAWNDYLQMQSNSAKCSDANLDSKIRISSCTTLIDTGRMDESTLATIHIMRAQAFQRAGNDDAALKDIVTATKRDPNSKKAWIALGNFRMAQKDYMGALESLNRAHAMRERDPAVDQIIDNDRGSVLEVLNRHVEAIADFTSAISLNPHHTKAYSNRATAYLASNQLDLAIQDLTEVIHAEPDNGRAFFDRGTAHERGGSYDDAIADYRKAIRLLPDFAPAAAALGSLLGSKHPDEALVELSTAIRLDPRSPALRARGALYLSLGQAERALADFNQVIANGDSDNIAYLNRGAVKAKLGDFAGAIQDYTRSIELGPPVIAAYINRGNAYASLHQNDAALTDFASAIQMDKRNVLALLGKAACDYASKRLTASLIDYSDVLAVDSTNAYAYFKRGNVYFDLRDFAASYADFSQSLRIDPNQALVYFNRSLAAGHLGRRMDSEIDFREAIRIDPSLATARSLASQPQ